MKKHLSLILTIVFFGSIWGIIEATIGYVLHLGFVPPFLAGSLLFPFAMLLLSKAYQVTQNRLSVVGIGVIAALIKGVNLFFPYTNVFKIINPMIMIVMESLLVFVVIQAFQKASWPKKVGYLLFASIGWRLLMCLYFGVQTLLNPSSVAFQIRSFTNFIQFTVLDGGMSSLLTLGLLVIDHRLPVQKWNFSKSWILSPAVFAFAIILTILL